MSLIVSRETILERAKREVLLLEAIFNSTTVVDRLLMDLSAINSTPEIAETYWPRAVERIRAEFKRLRQKKGRKTS